MCADRPMLFRPEMVRALLDGRKSQTRRPALRPHKLYGLAATAAMRIKVGDLIWVKEQFIPEYAAFGGYRDVAYRADQTGETKGAGWKVYLPRKFSRLTLVVTGVKIERLQDMSAKDAAAEGIEQYDGLWRDYGYREPDPARGWLPWARDSYRSLYEAIHGKGAWDANPDVVAITFTVHKANIDAFKTRAAA